MSERRLVCCHPVATWDSSVTCPCRGAMGVGRTRNDVPLWPPFVKAPIFFSHTFTRPSVAAQAIGLDGQGNCHKVVYASEIQSGKNFSWVHQKVTDCDPLNQCLPPGCCSVHHGLASFFARKRRGFVFASPEPSTCNLCCRTL